MNFSQLVQALDASGVRYRVDHQGHLHFDAPRGCPPDARLAIVRHYAVLVAHCTRMGWRGGSFEPRLAHARGAN